MTIKWLCDEIANELNARGLTIRNKVTGREVHSGDDVYEFDSHGELFHVYQWYVMLFPARVDADGVLHATDVSVA